MAIFRLKITDFKLNFTFFIFSNYFTRFLTGFEPKMRNLMKIYFGAHFPGKFPNSAVQYRINIYWPFLGKKITFFMFYNFFTRFLTGFEPKMRNLMKIYFGAHFPGNFPNDINLKFHMWVGVNECWYIGYILGCHSTGLPVRRDF